jgi:hypothetical protein
MAVYDQHAKLMGDLGQSSPAVLAALPLPLHMIWAHVLLTAKQLGHAQVMQHAAAVLLPRFLHAPGARQLLWQAHPADRFSIDRSAVAAAASPLLRLLVQCLYVTAGANSAQQSMQLNGQRSSKQGVSGNPCGIGATAAGRALLLSWQDSAVPAQVHMVESCAQLLVGMQVRISVP